MINRLKFIKVFSFLLLSIGAIPSVSHAIYLNFDNMSVALGSSMTAEPFGNQTTAVSLVNAINAPSASALEAHTSANHVWVNGGPLELDFDFGMEYDLSTLHFWNYWQESFDVDNIDFNFFDASSTQVGSLLGVAPSLGGGGVNSIFSENLPLSFPSKVQFVNAVFTGTNNQVDFNNIGFTGELTTPTNPTPPSPAPVPEPSAVLLFGTGVAGLLGWKFRKRYRQ